MIPHCYLLDSEGRMVVADVGDPAGLVEGVDYIAMQEVTDVAGKENRTDADGHISVNVIDPAGLVAWVDYTPVHIETGNPAINAWSGYLNYFIPIVVDAEESVPNAFTIDSTPAPTFSAGVADTYDFNQNITYTGSGTITFSLPPGGAHSAGITFNGGTGVLTYDGENSPTSYERSLQVTDGVDTATSDPFNIVIEAAAGGEVTFPDAATYFGTTDSTGNSVSTVANHVVTAGTTVLLIAVGIKANEELVSVAWNSESATLISDLDDQTSSGFVACEIWGILSPTPDTGDIVVTNNSVINDCHWIAAINVHGTTEASLAAAVQVLTTDLNNATATNTNVHAEGGTLGNKVMFVGVGQGDDMITNITNDANFASLVTDNTGGGSGAGLDLSAYIAERDAPSAVTVTWGATDENVGALLEFVAEGGGGSPEASFGVVQGDVSYLPIIPGIRGWGTETPGGSGRHLSPTEPETTVLFIDDLSASSVQTSANSGSFEWCVTQNFPRVVVAATSGLVEYSDVISTTKTINITNPYMTLAFHTAPEPGLHVYGCVLQCQASDVVLWHYSGFVTSNPLLNGVFSQPKGNAVSLGGGAATCLRSHMINCQTLFSADQSWQIFNSGSSTAENCTVWQTLAAMGQFQYTAFGPTITHEDSTAPNSLLRNLYIKNHIRNPKIDKGTLENSNSFGYDNNRNIAFDSKNSSSMILNIRNNVMAKGPNGDDNANSCITFENFGGSPPFWTDGGYYCITGNRKFSDYQNANLIQNTTADPVQTVPHASADPEGLVLRTIPDNDAGMIAFAEVMADHCGATPAHRHTFIQSIITNMLAYMNGGTDTIARIDEPNDIPGGWPMTVAENAIDHTTTGSHGAGTIPTGAAQDVVQASGYTALEEWLHLHNDWAMGTTGWRL